MRFRRFLKQLVCRHWWQSHLILSGGKYTHHDTRQCIKCGKSETVFSGTRAEWYEHHGWDGN